ncbi:hypothetical protein MIR68_006633 [Amoeboaphelidium protococcarum]|nr:hypothetical protein MIR68_006633 [Amoeboaphelidium protococcarum]
MPQAEAGVLAHLQRRLDVIDAQNGPDVNVRFLATVIRVMRPFRSNDDGTFYWASDSYRLSRIIGAENYSQCHGVERRNLCKGRDVMVMGLAREYKANVWAEQGIRHPQGGLLQTVTDNFAREYYTCLWKHVRDNFALALKRYVLAMVNDARLYVEYNKKKLWRHFLVLCQYWDAIKSGLSNGDHGRMCGLHSTNCGVAVTQGTNLKLRKSSITVPRLVQLEMDMNEDEAMQAGPKKKGRPKKRQMQDKLVQQQVTTFKAFIWKNGVECCFVGFVSKVFQSLYDDALDGRVVLISRVSIGSDKESEERRSREHHGLAMGLIIG